jgi:radical SAM-linked protein
VRGDAGCPVRLRFSKRGKIRFVSHRDVARAFERSLRIAGLPVASTAGFSPRPKLSFGLALGVGYESDAEFLDVELREPTDADQLPDLLTAGLPPGLAVGGAAPLAPRVPALQESVTAVGYELTPSGLASDTLAAATRAVDAATTLPVATTRKAQPVVVDVRPSLRELAVTADGHRLTVEVSTQPRAARPTEILTALRTLAGVDPDDGEDRVLRTHQWIERDGARYEPLAADRAPSAPAGAVTRAPVVLTS